MDSHATGDGAARSDSRERRSESQHSRSKSRKDSRKSSNSSSRGNNWQRFENSSRPNFASFSDGNRPDVRPKIPSLRCEGIPLTSRRQNRSVKAECFVNLVYEDERSIRRDRTSKNSARKSSSSHKRTVYTTENYMQANCQFVVDNNCSTLASKLREDPDYAPPWNTICEVRLLASSEPNCPICMNKPVARRITTCGHLFCLPCLLQYFTIKAEKTVPCPICFTKIDVTCMKPVSVVSCVEYAVGDTITFALSRCRKGTTVVELVDTDSAGIRLSNVVFASKMEMISRLEADKNQLSNVLRGLSGSESAEESCFVSEAIKLLEGEIEELEISDESQNNSLEILGVSPPKPDNIVFYVDAFDELKFEGPKPELSPCDKPTSDKPIVPSDEAKETKTVPVALESKSNDIDNSYFYFYQSLDGQRIYLNSFNVRCLLRQYSHLSRCPGILTGKIVGIEYINVSADVRNQFRYLSHLPLNSHFQSTEIELHSVLSDEILHQFAGEIERRKSERVLRQTKEDAYSKRAECLMERMTEAASEVTPIALDEPLHYDHAAFLADSPCLFTAEEAAADSESPTGGIARPSFARILTTGRPLDNDFPQLGSPPIISPIVAMAANAPRTTQSAARAVQARVSSASPSPFAKVKMVKLSSSVASQAIDQPQLPKEINPDDDDSEYAYAVPDAPRTLADCLSGISLSQDNSNTAPNWKKSKKKSEAKLLFSSGRGHALLN